MAIWILLPLVLAELGICAIGGLLARKAVQTKTSIAFVFGILLVAVTGGHAAMTLGGELSGSMGGNLSRYVSSVGALLVAMGFAALYLAAWRFHRPDAGWALGLSGSASLALLYNWTSMLARGALPTFGRESRETLVLLVLICGALAWWGLESLASFGRMRRRAALDLAEPLIATRLLMLACSTLSFAGAAAIALASSSLFGWPASLVPASQASLAFLTVAGVTTGYFAFAPPDVYRRLDSRPVES